MQPGGVGRRRTHGPDSEVKRARGWRQDEGFGLVRGDALRERFSADRSSGAVNEQAADVAAAEREISGTQTASIRCAQGREQQEEAGEMAVPQAHVLLS